LPPNWERLLAVVFDESGEPELVKPSLFLPLRLPPLKNLMLDELPEELLLEPRVVSTASS
jgi:hypothetical protein